MDISKAVACIWALFTITWISFWWWQPDQLSLFDGAWVALGYPGGLALVLIAAVWILKRKTP